MPKLKFQYVRQHRPETLLQFLTRRFRYHDRDEWKQLVEQGHVTVNGQRVAPQHLLQTTERIVYDRPRFVEPEVDRRYAVLYEDDVLLAVDKSGNIPTSPSGKYWYNCLVHVLQTERGLPELYAVHRLDRETSGVNLFAKTKAVAGRMGEVFHAGATEKRYTAILRGHLPVRAAYVSAPVADDPHSRVHIRQAVRPGGRPCRTRFALRALLPGASLVSLEPLTGRTHQIRAHAAYLGHPVWNDKLYGVSDEEFIASVSDPQRHHGPRHLLHATTLAFDHPVSGRRVTLRADDRVLMEAFYTGSAGGSPASASSAPLSGVRSRNA